MPDHVPTEPMTSGAHGAGQAAAAAPPPGAAPGLADAAFEPEPAAVVDFAPPPDAPGLVVGDAAPAAVHESA